MSYLLYNTKEEAINRAEQAGISLNLSYHRGDINGSRYGGGRVFKTTSGKYAWPVEESVLTSAEKISKVSTAEIDLTESGFEDISYS